MLLHDRELRANAMQSANAKVLHRFGCLALVRVLVAALRQSVFWRFVPALLLSTTSVRFCGDRSAGPLRWQEVGWVCL